MICCRNFDPTEPTVFDAVLNRLYRACVFCNSSRCFLFRLPGDDFGGGFEGGKDLCHYDWMQGHYPRRALGQDVG